MLHFSILTIKPDCFRRLLWQISNTPPPSSLSADDLDSWFTEKEKQNLHELPPCSVPFPRPSFRGVISLFPLLLSQRLCPGNSLCCTVKFSSLICQRINFCFSCLKKILSWSHFHCHLLPQTSLSFYAKPLTVYFRFFPLSLFPFPLKATLARLFFTPLHQNCTYEKPPINPHVAKSNVQSIHLLVF